jgi:7-cyano-7-deazaguanine synthase
MKKLIKTDANIAKASKAIVVLSGGQDSTTCLFWAKKYYDEIHAITFDYGQRHRIEIDSAIKVAQLAGVESHEIIKVPDCLKSSSPLTSTNDLETYDNSDQMDGVIGNRRETTFVAMRNALFLTIAANRAEALGVDNIVTGVCQMDTANYDDCRKTFLTATEQYINTALGNDHRGTPWIKVIAPLMFLTKSETVTLAKSLEGCWYALAYSHTCYAGQYPPCGVCHSCILRQRGFNEAEETDPLIMRSANESN